MPNTNITKFRTLGIVKRILPMHCVPLDQTRRSGSLSLTHRQYQQSNMRANANSLGGPSKEVTYIMREILGSIYGVRKRMILLHQIHHQKLSGRGGIVGVRDHVPFRPTPYSYWV